MFYMFTRGNVICRRFVRDNFARVLLYTSESCSLLRVKIYRRSVLHVVYLILNTAEVQCIHCLMIELTENSFAVFVNGVVVFILMHYRSSITRVHTII